jgi:hypothetical protein
MPIKTACPSCKATVNAPDKVAGKKCSCPRCGGVLHVPRIREEEDRGEPRGGLSAWGWVWVAVGGVCVLACIVVAVVVAVSAAVEQPVVLPGGQRGGGGGGVAAEPAAQPGMTLAAFKAQRPAVATKVRCRCRLGNLYNFAYRDCQESHYSLNLDGEYAWVPRGSDAGKRVYEILKDGEWHTMTLLLRYAGPHGEPVKADERGVAVEGIASER